MSNGAAVGDKLHYGRLSKNPILETNNFTIMLGYGIVLPVDSLRFVLKNRHPTIQSSLT